MAYVNFKNSPSEETPLTGGAAGNLNVMQENGTSHGADTKLGYAQSFLNEHIINVSNEVNEDYRVNVLHSRNLLEVDLSKYPTTTYSGVTNTDNGNQSITLNGTQAQNGNLYLLGNGSRVIKRLKAGKTYTLKLYVVSGSLTGVGNFIMGIGGSANYRYSSISTTSESVVITFTPETDINITSLRIFATGAAGITYSNLVLKFQINEGSEATTYEPYITPSINVDGDEIYSKSTILWQNSSPTSDMANNASLTLNTDDYITYEVLWVMSTSDTSNVFSSGRIPKGKSTILNTARCASGGTTNYERPINYNSDTLLKSGIPYSATASARSATASVLIPYMILGWK